MNRLDIPLIIITIEHITKNNSKEDLKIALIFTEFSIV